jgi:cation:H+ antiporter
MIMLIVYILGIIATSILIFVFGNYFARASSNLGDYFNLPKSVKGATFDAIASSLPELLVALFAVIFFNQFEVGIGTIAGSALFNLLIIPGICVLVTKGIFKVSKEVISRDALFYIISVFILLVLILYFPSWGIVVSILLLLAYLIYVREIIIDSKEYKRNNPKRKEKREKKISRDIWTFFIMIIGIGIVTYFLTNFSIEISKLLNVSPIIIAFTITAAATSIPDAAISIINARKGNLDDATSNVFGSNIFDIFVGLGLPLLIYSIFLGPVEIVFDQLEILIGLLGSTIIVLYFFARKEKLTKKQGIILLILYLVFLGYVIGLGV